MTRVRGFLIFFRDKCGSVNCINKEAFLSLFGDKICPPLGLAFSRDPMTPDHQIRLLRFDLEGKTLRTIVTTNLMDLTDGDIDRCADCLITSLTQEGLEFFLPHFIYYFVLLQERGNEFSLHFSSTIFHALNPELGITDVFNQQELQAIVEFFKSIMDLDIPFSRRFPDNLARLEAHVDAAKKKTRGAKYRKGK